MTFAENAASVAVVVVPLVGLQTFWIARSLDQIAARLDRVEGRIDGLEQTLVRDHGERITRLEAKLGGAA